jgi:hypothetical protein
MTLQAKRGFLPSDAQDFGEQSLPLLRKAAQEVLYLLDRGYPVTGTTRFVGDRYQLSERQRLALARTLSPTAHAAARRQREVQSVRGKTVCIDGFNVIIGLEIAFSDSMLFTCMDGTVRDLAGLHGTYRPIPQTDAAIRALLHALTGLGCAGAVIYLDKPVSNSGRLRQRILGIAEGLPFPLAVLIENPADAILKTKPLVATGDAIILDECAEWFNLVRYILDTQLSGFPLVDILPRGCD